MHALLPGHLIFRETAQLRGEMGFKSEKLTFNSGSASVCESVSGLGQTIQLSETYSFL